MSEMSGVPGVPPDVPWWEDAINAACRSLHGPEWDGLTDIYTMEDALTAVYPVIAGAAKEIRGDLYHLLQPIIGMARMREAYPDSPPIDLVWLVERLYVALDVLDNAIGEPSRLDEVVEQYRRHGMPQRRPEGVAAMLAQKAARSFAATPTSNAASTDAVMPSTEEY